MISTNQHKVKGVEEIVFAGIEKQIERYFGVRAKLTSYADGYEVFARKQDRSPTYPFGFLSFEDVSFEPEAGFFRADTLANTYLQTNKTEVNEKGVTEIQYISIMPAIFGITFHYITQDLQDVIRLSALWGFCARKAKLDFDLMYQGIKLTIKVEPDFNLSIPKKETPATTAGAMEYEGVMRVTAYMSSPLVEDNPVLPLFNEIELSFYVQHNSAELGEVKQANLDRMDIIKIKRKST